MYRITDPLLFYKSSFGAEAERHCVKHILFSANSPNLRICQEHAESGDTWRHAFFYKNNFIRTTSEAQIWLKA